MKFELVEYHRNVSDSELLQDVLRVQKIYGKDTLTREEYEVYGKYSRNTFCRHFGGWNQALELCGLRVNDQQRHAAQGSHNYGHITDEQLKADLVRVAKILGVPTFSSGEYSKHGEWAVCTYFKRFKTWNEALKHAGLQPYAQVAGKKIEKEKLLAEIERIWVKLGRQPTTTDIKTESQFILCTPFPDISEVGDRHLPPLSTISMMPTTARLSEHRQLQQSTTFRWRRRMNTKEVS